jgi:hypothetical protein
MTKDDVIRMAREAGLYHFYDSEGHCSGITDARLVDEDQERCDDRLVEMLAPFANLVAAAEREACAKVAKETVCDMHLGTGIKIYGTKAAAAIRARGQA